MKETVPRYLQCVFVAVTVRCCLWAGLEATHVVLSEFLTTVFTKTGV